MIPRMRAALAALAVAIAAAAASAAPAAQEPIKFGYLNALTGPYAVAGVPELNGIRLAIAHINAAGGVCNRQLQLAATEDDQGQPNLSTAGLRKLVQQEGLKIVIGPGITPPALATAPLAESLKIFYMVEVAQRVHRPLQGDPPVLQDVAARAEVEGELRVLLDQEDRESRVPQAC